jgi:hypothetical protein
MLRTRQKPFKDSLPFFAKIMRRPDPYNMDIPRGETPPFTEYEKIRSPSTIKFGSLQFLVIRSIIIGRSMIEDEAT